MYTYDYNLHVDVHFVYRIRPNKCIVCLQKHEKGPGALKNLKSVKCLEGPNSLTYQK